MNKIDLISMAFKNLAKRKIRTALTILSVVIGATSIIVMVSLGVALDEKFNEEIKNMSNITLIELGGYNDKISKEDIEKIKTLENIQAVSPYMELYGVNLGVDGRYVGIFDVAGIDAANMEIFGYKTESGRILNNTDTGKNSIVFGAKTIYGFSKKGKGEPWYKFIEEPTLDKNTVTVDVLNSRIKLYTDANYGINKKYLDSTGESSGNHKTFNMSAVGILEKKDDYRTDHKIYMPYESVEKLKKEIDKANGNKQDSSSKKNQGYARVLVKVNDINNVDNAVQQIKDIFTESKKEISVQAEAEYIQATKRMTKMVQALLGGIGSISLFIAAIGIANTMVMSIYERTKEIGIMKVIGAKVSDIKNIFLLEATLIGVMGGFVGVLFSYLISFSLNKVVNVIIGSTIEELGVSAQKISSIPLWLVIGALTFSALIGLLAGYLPARRVLKIEPLKAIKSE